MKEATEEEIEGQSSNPLLTSVAAMVLKTKLQLFTTDQKLLTNPNSPAKVVRAYDAKPIPMKPLVPYVLVKLSHEKQSLIQQGGLENC